MHNGRSNAINLDWDLGWLDVANLESKEENWRINKEELKNLILQFHMTMWIKPKRGTCCSGCCAKFHMKLRNDLESYYCFTDFTQPCKIDFLHAK